MSTSSSSRVPAIVSAGAVVAAPRLFDRLDAAGKERVTLLLSRVQALLPIEHEAFLQELYRQQEDAQRTLAFSKQTRGKLVRYIGPSLEAVQARDRAYVTPRTLPAVGQGDEVGGEDEANQQSGQRSPSAATNGDAVARSTDRAAPPCSLEDLVRTPGMFGEAKVTIHLEKMSLYDKLHQNMANMKGHTAPTLDSGIDASPMTEQQQQQLQPAAPSQSGEHAAAQLQTTSSAPCATVTTNNNDNSDNNSGAASAAPYRSNAYQAVRLAMSAPGFIASQKPSSTTTTQTGYDGVQSVLNTTGLPINEEDLREWFDELDEEGRGVLSLEEFQRYTESLERDFGVTSEYAALQRAAEQLAFDGHLNFEAFAYLVLRFARE